MVIWRLPITFKPLRGFRAPYFARTAISPGISFSASSISLRPQSDREISATLNLRSFSVSCIFYFILRVSNACDFPQFIRHVRFFPGVIVHKERLRQFSIYVCIEKVKLFNHASWRQVECLSDYLGQPFLRDNPRPEGIHVDGKGSGNTDGIG